MRQVLNRVRPITVADDLKNLKIRVPESPTLIAVFKAFGATPTPLNYKDVYVGLSTKLIDGAEMGYFAVESGKFYEVMKYASVTNHAWTSNSLLASMTAWQRLPQKLRDIAKRRFDEAADLERRDMERLDATLTTQLTAQGMVFNRADVATFRAAIRNAGLYGQWRTTFGPEAWAALERATGPLS
jgi:TRAP-type C4-dicarboxylate transport system substrate-binding protein